MARPQKPLKLDADQIRYLASIGVSDEHIAVLAGAARSTIQTRFRRELIEGRARLREKLLAAMWKRVEAGSDKMMIWLSQQFLDMRPAAPRGEQTDTVTIRVIDDDPDATRSH